LESKGLEPSTY